MVLVIHTLKMVSVMMEPTNWNVILMGVIVVCLVSTQNIVLTVLVIVGQPLNVRTHKPINSSYRKVASRSTSRLVARPRIF